MKRSFFIVFCIVYFSLAVFLPVKANLEEDSMVPFWSGETMYNESVLPISYSGGTPEARLLFTPKSIISVKSASLEKDFIQGKDWILDGNILKLPNGSNILYLKDTDVSPPRDPNIAYPGDVFYPSRQIVVTYTHNGKWQGPIPIFAGIQKLPNTLEKLSKQKSLNIILFGDSISLGYSSSGALNVEPYLPTWGQMMVNKLKKIYGSEINFINSSMGGQDSNWGANDDVINEQITSKFPDLVIIGFGVNDGSGNIDPNVFKNNILHIIEKVQQSNSKAEFIIISSILHNPEWRQGVQPTNYLGELQNITKTGVVLADMTSVHQELLKNKKYIDMTGNNLNHPNDFLARWYAQMVGGILFPSSTGWLDGASCTSVWGWAGSLNNLLTSSYVQINVDNQLLGRTYANLERDKAVCDALGFSQVPCIHGFNYSVPDSLKDGKTHTIDAYVIGLDGKYSKIGGSGVSVTCASPVATSVGDATIDSNDISVSTKASYGGGITSIRYKNKEFVDLIDHGRGFQIAWQNNNRGECFNPIQHGSRSDGNGDTTTAKVIDQTVTQNSITSVTQAAYWLKPGEQSIYCNFDTNHLNYWTNGISFNTSIISDSLVYQTVSLNPDNLTNTISLKGHIKFGNSDTLAEPLNFIMLEQPAIYTLKQNVPNVYRYNYFNHSLVGPIAYNDRLGGFVNSNLPVILSSTDKQTAIGFYSNQVPENIPEDFPQKYIIGYGIMDIDANIWYAPIRMAHLKNNIQTNDTLYFQSFIVFGNMSEVTDKIDKLIAKHPPLTSKCQKIAWTNKILEQDNCGLGDANGDVIADLIDFSIWKKEYLNNQIEKADFNQDNKVDLVDFSLWKKNYFDN